MIRKRKNNIKYGQRFPHPSRIIHTLYFCNAITARLNFRFSEFLINCCKGRPGTGILKPQPVRKIFFMYFLKAHEHCMKFAASMREGPDNDVV